MVELPVGITWQFRIEECIHLYALNLQQLLKILFINSYILQDGLQWQFEIGREDTRGRRASGTRTQYK